LAENVDNHLPVKNAINEENFAVNEEKNAITEEKNAT
jgi:hypothetical protein